MSKGVLLISFGIDYDRIAPYCAKSIRRFSDIPILVHTNVPEFIRSREWNCIHGIKFILHEMNDSENRVIKTQLSKYTEFDNTLYIDVDSEVMSSRFIEPFKLLNRYSVISPEWKRFSIKQIRQRSIKESKFKNFLNIFKMFNIEQDQLIAGGLCYFSRNHSSNLFFTEFNRLWKITGCKEDMPALNGAMFKYRSAVGMLPKSEYNNYNSTIIQAQHNSLMSYGHMKRFTRRRCNQISGSWEYCTQGNISTFSKPRIAFIYDVKGWAFYNMAYNIKRELNDYYEIDILCHDKIKNNNKYDAIICFSPNVVPSLCRKEKVICGISSHSVKNIEKLNKYNHVFANDINLYEKIDHKNKYYVPNGVDSSLFNIQHRAKLNSHFKIGAIGTVSRMDHKGYSRIKSITDMINSLNCKRYLNCSLFVDTNKRILSQSELLKYYSDINIFIVSSLSETGPNPLLEAMSCGVPAICNEVGLVPFLINHGENGFIVDDYNDIESYVRYIQILSSNHTLYRKMSTLARASAINYDWSIRAHGFKEMIDSYLGRKEASSEPEEFNELSELICHNR